MAGILTYFAIILLTAIWVLGWMGIAAIVGAFFDLPLSTCALIGTTLGPLGFIVVVLLGTVEKRRLANSVELISTMGIMEAPIEAVTEWDPFK